MDLKITRNGKRYNNLEEAFTDSIQDAVREHINKILAPYRSEIAKENGSIVIQEKEDGDLDIKISGISDELKEKIEKDLGSEK